MKNLKTIIGLGLCLILGACVEKTEVKVDIPMSGVNLSVPSNQASFDLNDVADTYRFSWSDAGHDSYTILFSPNSVFEPYYAVEAGSTTQIELSPDQLDIAMSALNMSGEDMHTIYWSVKPTGKLEVAASDIRTISMKRMHNFLTKPEDAGRYVLNADAQDTKVQFEWEERGAAGQGYELLFSTDMNFEDPLVIAAGTENKTEVTHAQLQAVIEDLHLKLFTASKVYWNVRNKATGENVSRMCKSLDLTGMMIFNDKRGDEVESYPVRRIEFRDGSSQIWLCENLRAKKYPDGTDIEGENIIPAYRGDNVPQPTEEMVRLFGAYYPQNIKNSIVPEGWRLPTQVEYDELFALAGIKSAKCYCIMYYDPLFWGELGVTEAQIPTFNTWEMNFIPAGQGWTGGGTITNAMARYCYLLTSDQTVSYLFDGYQTFPTGSTFASVRLIYNED